MSPRFRSRILVLLCTLGFADSAFAKCAEFVPFMDLTRRQGVHVLRIEIIDMTRGKVKCREIGVCETTVLVAHAIPSDLDGANRKAATRIASGDHPDAFPIDRLAKGSQWIVAARTMPPDSGADYFLDGCAESALRIVGDSVTGIIRNTPGRPVTLTIDQLGAEIAQERTR